MADLERIQRWMQAVIMSQGGAQAGVASAEAREVIAIDPEEVEQVVTRSRSLSAVDRLDIYNRAYFARLVDCLREEFPVLRHALGEEAFDHFALDYLERHPSRSYTLNELGADFPRFLADSKPDEEIASDSGVNLHDFIVDLVTLEKTFNDVFDGPGMEDRPLLNEQQLAAVPPDRWSEARLEPAICLRLLALRYPVERYFAAVRAGKDTSYPRPRATFLAITRRQYVVRHFPLTRLQHVLLSALAQGKSIGAAISLAADHPRTDLEKLATKLRDWFRKWTEAGFFQAVHLPAEE
jgi:hypothetical protein